MHILEKKYWGMILEYFSEQHLAQYVRFHLTKQVLFHSCRRRSPGSAEICKLHLYSSRACYPQPLQMLLASPLSLLPTCTPLMPNLLLHTLSCIQETVSSAWTALPPALLHPMNSSFTPLESVQMSPPPWSLPCYLWSIPGIVVFIVFIIWGIKQQKSP